jgi:hypothetical protein
MIDEANDACFIVRDNTGQAFGYFYFEDEPGRRTAAKLLTNEVRTQLSGPPRPNDDTPGLIVPNLHALLGVAGLVVNPGEPIGQIPIHCAKSWLICETVRLVRLLREFKGHEDAFAIRLVRVLVGRGDVAPGLSAHNLRFISWGCFFCHKRVSILPPILELLNLMPFARVRPRIRSSRPQKARGEHCRRPRHCNLNLKERWKVGKWHGPVLPGQRLVDQ